MDTPKPALQLSAAQIITGALASVSAAVVASTFGVTGTLLGAALSSVVSTIAAALYSHSLERALSSKVGLGGSQVRGGVVRCGRLGAQATA